MAYRLGSLFLGFVGVSMLTTSGFAKDVDWGAIHPGFKDATFVRDSNSCYSCHDTTKVPYAHTAHAKAFKLKSPSMGDCESCHGPRSKHVQNPGRDLVLSTAQQSKVCQQCHEGGGRKHWSSGRHASADVGCTSCHKVMTKVSERGLLTQRTEEATCSKCHAEVRGELNKVSHHPVREGKMTCSGCHDAHGSPTRGMLKGASINETCYGCHQEKRGPFVWEHPPVRENCLNCHLPHGSNNRKLTSGKDSFLCMQCHTYGGHINLIRYNRTSNPTREGCVNCHMAIHGSVSPSGPKFVR